VIVFSLIAAVLAVAGLFLMFRDVLRGGVATRVDPEQANIDIARDRLAKLDAVKQQGNLEAGEYEAARAEIEQQLAQELADSTPSAGNDHADVEPAMDATDSKRGRWMVWLASPLILALVFALYWRIGDMRALDPAFVTANSPAARDASRVAENNSAQGANAGADEKLPSIEELLPRLEAHLEQEPTDAKGWNLLGTTYLRLRRFKDAESALGKAHNLLPDDVPVMLQLADARAMLSNGTIGDDSLGLVERALELEPDNVQGNWLMGMAAQQRGDNATAIQAWEKLLPMLEGDPESQQQIRMMISQASGDGAAATSGTVAQSASADNNTAANTSSEAAAQPGINVVVTLAEQLADTIDQQTPVFVYAKAESGPPMPLAVVKRTVADLPLTIRLDDSLAMMPNLKLSSFETVVVGARASLSGGPVAETGDFYVEVTGIAVAPEQSSAVVSLEIATAVE